MSATWSSTPVWPVTMSRRPGSAAGIRDAEERLFALLVLLDPDAAVARLLVAVAGCLEDAGREPRIHVHLARLEGPNGAPGSVEIAGEHAGRQPVARVVGDSKGV